MTKNKVVNKKLVSSAVILSLQVLASALLAFLIYKLSVLPPLFLGGLVAVLLLLCLGSYLLMRPSKKKKNSLRPVIFKIVSLVMSIALIVGSLYIVKGGDALANLTGANTKTSTYSLIVLKDSKVKDIYDLKRKTIAISTDYEEKTEDAVDLIKKEITNVRFEEVEKFADLADVLYDKDADAILIDEGLSGVLEERHPDFMNETKVVWTYGVDEIVDTIAKEVRVTKDPFNIYVSGIDTRGKVSTVSRSDVNMIVTVNPETKQILMTSIPRDYYVTLADMGKKDKLTHSGLSGTENTVKTVENFMGIDINYYVRVNFTSVVKIVDALGGITVTVPFDFYSGVDGSLFKKGTQTFNGEQAMKYCRERKAFGGGDGARVRNQQVVLTAMIKKMISPSIITKYNKILDAIDGSFETNMKATDITDLLEMQLSDMAAWDIQTITLTGTGKTMTGGAYMPSDNLYYLIPDEESIEKAGEYIDQMIDGKKIIVTAE